MSVGEYADLLEWQANQRNTLVMTEEQERAMRETGKAELHPDSPTVESLNSDVINELLDKKGLIEKELKSVLEKKGMDTSKLKNLLMEVRSGLNGPEVDVAFASKEDEKRISAILSKPENSVLRNLIGTYIDVSKGINQELKASTGLNEADLFLLVKNGVSLENANNDKLQNLFAEDPGLASALESYVRPDQLLTSVMSPGGQELARSSMSGLEHAITSTLEAVRMKFGEEEYQNLRENLVITANSNGEYTITGVSNKEIRNRIEELVKVYVTDESKGHVASLKQGADYQKALNNTPGEATTSFTLTFGDDEDSGSTVRHGANAYGEEEEAAARKDISEAVNKQINDTLKQENRNTLASPVDITVNENGKLSVKLPSTDPNRKFITDMLDKLNESLLENIKKMRNGEEVSDPISGMVFDLVRYGGRRLG